MPTIAELIGAASAVVGLGILTLCSVRSITRRRAVRRPSGCPAESRF
ncbi:hypothetical protein [Streptomyces sp. HUAS TT20]|nr:hypothetical protein [Streptomyces sp. HUAS 15-9]UXY32924.1 hypothetical protein N8I87_30385 [Streptomyces sp. HUAS 15-9]